MVTAREHAARLRAALEQAGLEDAAFEAVQLLEIVGISARRTPDAGAFAAPKRTAGPFVGTAPSPRPLAVFGRRMGLLGFYRLCWEGVLIPRPDTELCAMLTVEKAAAAGENACVLDLCSGSGIIALAAALHCRKRR